MNISPTSLPAPSRSFSDNAPANPAVPALVAEPCREGDVALVYRSGGNATHLSYAEALLRASVRKDRTLAYFDTSDRHSPAKAKEIATKRAPIREKVAQLRQEMGR